tara:strand:+ start:22 stop:327 length:306 start_codon:yes stop_codon:yes gene_type:complete
LNKQQLKKVIMRLIETKKGLSIETKFGGETIHLNHTHETVAEFSEDVWQPFMVAEEATNFARVHLITAENEDHALSQIDEYLREKEYCEETHLIMATELEY